LSERELGSYKLKIDVTEFNKGLTIDDDSLEWLPTAVGCGVAVATVAAELQFYTNSVILHYLLDL